MSGKRLFMGPTPHQFTQASEESASRMIRSFTEDQLRASSLEGLVQAVVGDKVPLSIVLDVEHHQIASGIVTSAPQSDEGWASVYRRPRRSLTGRSSRVRSMSPTPAPARHSIPGRTASQRTWSKVP
jgi:hypothetical protein